MIDLLFFSFYSSEVGFAIQPRLASNLYSCYQEDAWCCNFDFTEETVRGEGSLHSHAGGLVLFLWTDRL